MISYLGYQMQHTLEENQRMKQLKKRDQNNEDKDSHLNNS